MPNERLHKALVSAQLGTDDLSVKTGVDVKTVQRWLAGRTPRARHRWAVANLLGEDERYLWPDSERRSAPMPGSTTELVAAYPHRAQMPTDDWWQLFAGARHQIDLLGFAILFIPESHPGLADLLAAKAADCCAVRIALADPDSPYVEDRDREEALAGAFSPRIRNSLVHFAGLVDVGGVQINLHSTPMYNSVFRFDDEMIVTPHLYGAPGYRSPLLQLRRLGPGGMFDNFAHHFDAIWQTSWPYRPSA